MSAGLINLKQFSEQENFWGHRYVFKSFQEEYGITPDETLAFGDNLNDIEMLKRASHSFAVENARDEVKEAANFVAPSYKEDGVLQVLKAVLSGELC